MIIVIDSIVFYSQALEGGGIAVREAVVASFVTLKLKGNTALSKNITGGGALGVLNVLTLLIINCTFVKNDARESTGGAIQTQNVDSIFLKGCTFRNNSAFKIGGGITFTFNNY